VVAALARFREYSQNKRIHHIEKRLYLSVSQFPEGSEYYQLLKKIAFWNQYIIQIYMQI